ncbi:MAG: cupin domain-containing protein [Actinomycetes bacterium]
MSGPVKPFVVPPGEGETVHGPAGGPATFKARTQDTNGTFTALENVIGPGQGPPLHLHAREDEMYYILDGHLRFKADGSLLDAPTGSFVFIPRNTAHCFQNVGGGPARILVMFTPAGMERFFEENAALAPGPDGSPDAEAYRAVAHGAWMQVLGPPLSVTDPL